MNDHAEKPAAAIGYSMVANLPGDRQLTMQCFVAEDESDADIRAKLDRAFGFLDRQKARYEIPDIEERIEQQQAQLSQMAFDLEAADKAFDEAQAGLAEQAAQVGAAKKTVTDAAYEAFTRSGRQGEHRLRGTDLAHVERADNQLASIKAEMEKNVAERDAHRNQILVGKKRYELAIEKDRAKLVEKERLIAADG